MFSKAPDDPLLPNIGMFHSAAIRPINSADELQAMNITRDYEDGLLLYLFYIGNNQNLSLAKTIPFFADTQIEGCKN